MTSNDIQRRRCREHPRRTFHRGKIFVILKKGVGDLVRSAVTIRFVVGSKDVLGYSSNSERRVANYGEIRQNIIITIIT